MTDSIGCNYNIPLDFRKMGDDRVSYMRQRDPSIDRRYRPRPKQARDLFREISEDSEYDDVGSIASSTTTTTTTTTTQASAEAEKLASVYLRLRPLAKVCSNYAVQDNVLKVRATESITTNNKDMEEKHYEFTDIFKDSTTQMEIYEQCVRPSIQNEENITVMAYGTSGSGKTYTMHGTENEAGVVQRAITHIFTKYANLIHESPLVKFDRGNMTMMMDSNIQDEIQLRNKYVQHYKNKKKWELQCRQIQQEHKLESFTDQSRHVFVWMSFVEIYNENVHDLLSTHVMTTKRKNLKIFANDGNSFVKDLISVHVRNESEAFAVMQYGLEQVEYAATNVNANSSRSHCVLIMNVCHFAPPDGFWSLTYRFCDLAGSERLKKTENTGNRLKEAQSINTSLMILGRCLDLLYQNQQAKSKEVVPYRESKLTMLLQKPLIGGEKITTIVNMAPNIDYLEENLHVLGFASIAHKILYKPTKAAAQKRRSTRFTIFVQSLSTRDDIDWDNLLSHSEGMESQNEELREERDRLIEHVQQITLEFNRKEQALREQLVDEREKQVKATIEAYEKRLGYVEKRSEQRVS